jgi:nucleotide-binding universal stress UspA family protein
MKKILVATDLSNNSKTAIRFAIQLASQGDYELTFLYVNSAFTTDPYAVTSFMQLPEPDNKLQAQSLRKFVQSLYKQTGKKPDRIHYITSNRQDITAAIMDCTKIIKADYLCVGTRGGGLINKILGSHTSKILTDSPIPVFIVPKYYRTTGIKSILYPSDITNITLELGLIKKFAAEFDAPIAVYHYDYFPQKKEVKAHLSQIERKLHSDKIYFYFKKLTPHVSLLQHLQLDILKTKPSLVVMFSKENRNWVEVLFQSLKTAQKSFDSKTPILVFKKNSQNKTL